MQLSTDRIRAALRMNSRYEPGGVRFEFGGDTTSMLSAAAPLMISSSPR